MNFALISFQFLLHSKKKNHYDIYFYIKQFTSLSIIHIIIIQLSFILIPIPVLFLFNIIIFIKHRNILRLE